MGSLNPEFVATFLENYHALQESGDLDARLFLMDLNTAMWNAPLTNTERRIINKLFISPPSPPSRDKVDKDGFSRGRPPGGTTQTSLGEELGIEKSTLSNLKRSAIEKMSAYLGEEYEL